MILWKLWSFLFRNLLGLGTFHNHVTFTDGCDLYRAPHPHGIGRGIFAGRSISEQSMIEVTPSIAVRKAFVDKTQLDFYAAGSSQNYSALLLGAAMLHNHREPGTVKNVWAGAFIEENTQTRPYSTVTDVNWFAKWEVQQGEEIRHSYGDSWFAERGIALKDGSVVTDKACLVEQNIIKDECRGDAMPLEFLQQSGVCITDVYVQSSQIAGAGRGLFAKKDFKAGSKVYVSPVVLLPKHATVEECKILHHLLQNYCIEDPSVAQSVLLPIGLSAMINHAEEEEANIELAWHFWSAEDEERLSPSFGTRDLEALPFAPLDVAYIAKRDIVEGEELTMSYGSSWKSRYAKYQVALANWYSGGGNITDIPAFRSFIEAPSGMFPSHWRGTDEL
eukprot:TRINITY_DN29655_c0_g2_i1.p1 TRINITY_DN29655_c0_g2~~TRINITY_DN29655_c0_g2_i1.p1  ORF type:complete len:390 (-),score=36.15 TRINITY_DN29655_c0_g2_i1:13-1182(-)